MRRNLLIALIAGAGAAAAAALIGAATVPAVGEAADEGRWLIGISAGLGAFAGASIGWICAATQARLESIGRLTSLQNLGLGRTKVTDDGLASLDQLKKLYRLDLSGNGAITDAGLVHLEPMVNMMYLETSGSAVTSAGLAGLIRAWEQRRLEAADSTKSALPSADQLP